MFHSAHEFETRANEAERLAVAASDPMVREDILSVARIYRDYASHLRDRPADAKDAVWKRAVRA